MPKLPQEFIEKTISTMFPGETLYTVPWALVVDEDGEIWLRGEFAVSEEPGGTVQMQVHREPGGYKVMLDPSYKYHVGLPVDWVRTPVIGFL